MNRDRALLEHILDCTAAIEEMMAGDNPLGERQSRDAILRNLQVLAESAGRLSDELKARCPAD